MVTNPKSRSSFWYGYLMAGERSSPVLRDNRLETGNPKTIYLFNLKRGEIIEKKLRELKPNVSKWIGELDTGYKKARCGFKGKDGGGSGVADARLVPLRKAADYGDDGAGEA